MTNEMTAEEAVKQIKENCYFASISEKTKQALDMAIKALEQEDILGKIKAEILEEAEYAYADFDQYKEDILHAEPDELPDDDFRYGMTNEQAIAYLEQADTTVYKKIKTKTAEALEIAIKALEAQSCEDTEVIKVSKGAVKARQGRFVIYDVDWLKENFYTTEEKIYGQPKQPSEDCISRQAVIRLVEQYPNIIGNRCSGLIADIKHLPSVTPQRPRGKWIITFPGGAKAFKCNQCNKYAAICHATDYCPNCGSYNRGGEDEACD